MNWLFCSVVLALALVTPGLAPTAPPILAAQSSAVPADGWNGERALELIGRARERRAEAYADTGLTNYQADARAYVYFYLDREDTGERNLVKTDQIALDVFWRAPDLTKQRIVGWRGRKSLPTNINYHIDHLAVVMENFGDEIRIGDGDEVQNVPHPAATGAGSFYEYRLVDSLTLRLPGTPEPVRVYELQVRPRDLSQPAFLGSVFVERRAGDLVRMDFTFTPSAYTDPQLDYINISLDNGLWEGRYWLPNEQRLEIRRQVPGLDVPAGSVIRGTMEVGNYRFNEALPLALFDGPPIVVAPREERERFPFEQEIHAELREEGIGPEAEMSEVRQQAREIAFGRALSGLGGGIEPWIPGASEIFRYNRAEGAAVALGARLSPDPVLSVGARAGWAFGPDHPFGEVALAWERESLDLHLSGYGNLPRDVGVTPVVSGAINSLSALLAGRDYLDPFYASGIGIEMERPASSGWMLSGLARAEAHRSAGLTTDFSVFGEPADFRPVQPIDEGTMWSAALQLTREAPAEVGRWWTAELRTEAGRLDAEDAALGTLAFVRPEASLGWGRQWDAADTRLELGARAGAAFGDLPRQALFLLGGRGTLPGYVFRDFGGDRYLLADATASVNLLFPWLRGRALAAAGWSGVNDAGQRALILWGAEPTDGIRTSVGAGLGIFYDILQIDVARGLGAGGEWELIIGVNRSFRDFL